MTMPNERTRATIRAAEYLIKLASIGDKEAREILRHYPKPFDLYAAGKACPDVFDAQVCFRDEDPLR